MTSDAGLLLPRELDERLGLSALIERHLTDPRTGRNRQFPLSDLFRQSVYSCLAGYEDTNDAERLAEDPAFRMLASGERRETSVALTSTLHWFETDVLTDDRNHQGLSRLSPAEQLVPDAFENGRQSTTAVHRWRHHTRRTRGESTHMNRKGFLVGILAAGCFVATSLMPSIGHAQADPRVAKSMETLKAMATKLGAPKLEGKEAVGGKDAPALYFGSTKTNNNFEIVDAVSKEDGKGMTATFFVKSGDEYIRVSTSVPKPDGSGRAIGTILDPQGKAIVEIKQGKPFYGEVTILGTPYLTGYEPMKDGSGNVIGIYYVGYKR